MNDKINGRTPEEIKKGLECCSTEAGCPGCPYYKECVVEQDINLVTADALAYIQYLEQKYIALINDVDYATSCVGSFCDICKYTGVECDARKIEIGECWEWRGVPQEVEYGTE